jgi:hypothetical protein
MEVGPIVLVGMPRSGSTLYSALLNQAKQVYLINDAYFLQEVDKVNAWQKFECESDARDFLKYVEALIIRRSAVRNTSVLMNSARMTADQLDAACTAISKVEVRDRNWHSILADIMTIAAESSGKKQWGWNTPQDLYHIERILSFFPATKFIFLMRDPFAVLKSFKYKPNKDSERRYHPLAQALAWKKAATTLHKATRQHPENVFLVKYEDLISKTPHEISRINNYLGIEIPTDLKLASLGTNSSFRKQQSTKRLGTKDISNLEAWLADSVLFEERQSLGYISPRRDFSVKGLFPFLLQTGSFVRYYMVALLHSPNTRKRVVRFLK